MKEKKTGGMTHREEKEREMVYVRVRLWIQLKCSFRETEENDG